jgi:peptidoglycan/xylan/chitin deacetylase (PgdA/CDA1 family)
VTLAWRGESRCVVALTIDFDGTANEVGEGLEPVGIHSAGAYSARRGVAALLEILSRHGVPATFFVPGFDAETSPEVVAAIAGAGHEVAAHGYLHEETEPAAEAEGPLLRRTHEILTAVTGHPPVGWRSPGGMRTERTLEHLSGLGYLYDSSDKDFDAPYPATIGGEASKTMIELPNNTITLDDYPYYVDAAATPSEVLAAWRDEFDAAYGGSGYFMLTVHPRAGFGSGTPARARVLARLIDHIAAHRDVEFLRLYELAGRCLRSIQASR